MIPPIATNFVAGETPAEAVQHARELNRRGVAVILNLLGEHYDDRADADADADAYVDLAETIAADDLDACISVKPSQIGLSLSDDAFRENLARIVDVADEHGVFVWIDMEDHPTTDVTLDAFERHARETDGNVGVCVQANLRRTSEDLERLAELPGKVRLVKGAYDEPGDIAYRKKAKVDEVYRDLLRFMFEAFDDGIAVGSHDPAMIQYAGELHAEHGTPYEVQMLMGVREEAQFDLAAEGVEVWQYVPYGGKWFSYFYRRVRERKSNALFALRAVVGR
ncbi:proline dehydrogenase family protein [Haloarchaeobius salinus]|uniref:proline dehydrogenase family protein n=1 Tax=Haloarchaeobius salinus TaxID=1198298 RepID=UPI00210BCEC2|nr:proline dehydrogenase family protein [Haloarchaeobius salinus]